MKTSALSHRLDTLLRYRLIEIIALWEGRLTTNHLCDAFGIGRQQASKDINNYIVDLAPDNLIYDKSLKGYKPSENFTPVVTSGMADEYLQLIARNRELKSSFDSLSFDHSHTEILNLPLRHLQPSLIRGVLQAAREQRRIEVDYVSVSDPNHEGRIIVPHTIAHTGVRWHLRAWCEKNQGYRDFVLSRFRGDVELLNRSEHGVEEDNAWNKILKITLTPDSRLNSEQQKVVAHDWGMNKRKQLHLEVRAALIQYALHTLNIDAHTIQADPVAQQIVIKNIDEIRPWLFS